MRVINFRAYEPVNKIMFFYNEVDGRETMQLYFEDEILKAQVVVAPEDGDDFGYKFFPCEVMQFTGLLDKKGNEVYEGDIVQAFTGKKRAGKFEIKYATKGFVMWQDGDRSELDCIWYYDFEVIGNIHENPDLLK